GQPARAVHAAIRPNARDLASNQYRVIEDANLVLNIRARNSLGTGFGLPIDYAIPIVNLDNIDSAIAYIPHNGVLWIWMRMGILGEILFWFLVATAVRRCYDLARVGDPESSLLGAFAICAIVAYVVMGYYDMGFFWFRIACCMGFLLGAVEARLRYLRLTPPVASEDGGRHEEGDGGVTEEAMLVLMEASLEATPLATSPPAPGSGPNPVAPPGSRSERGDVKVAPLEAVVSRADRHEPGPGLGTSGSPAAAGGEAAPSSFVTWPRPRSTTPGHYPPGAFKEEPAPHEIPLPDQHPGRHPGGSGDWPTTPVTGRLLAIRVLNYLTNHAVSRVPSFGLRHLWYRRVLGVDLGRGASIQLGCYVWFYGPGQLRRSGLRIGSHTRINRDCCLDARGALVIGDNVSISPEVAILTTQHDYASEDFALDTRTVTIGDHVWIGTRAVVLPGARIGRGAVVAAGAVVSGEV
ncbi:MAG: DapH/DapD/GlmU-related protein, partial [Candidatus Dormibacteria bacterium]